MHMQFNQSESSKLEQNNIIPYEKFRRRPQLSLLLEIWQQTSKYATQE